MTGFVKPCIFYIQCIVYNVDIISFVVPGKRSRVEKNGQTGKRKTNGHIPHMHNNV